MNDITTYTFLAIGLVISIILAVAGIWLLIQAMLWILCHDIKRVLLVRNQTAYEYLQIEKF